MIKPKPKPCKGTGQAKGHGCGNPVERRVYGLGINCCYKDWLMNSEAGKAKVERSRIRAHKLTEKEKRQKAKEQKIEIMRKSDYEKVLQSLVNAIVRMVDLDRGCISCEHGWDGNFHRQRHAGHRYSVRAHPGLRFDMFNIFGQCSICNNWLSGNELQYTKGLIKHHGQEYVEILEEHKLKYKENHLTIPELQEAIKNASEVKKQLIKGRYFGRQEINDKIGIYK